MLEMRSHGKEIVQSIHSGTMDLNLLLKSLCNVERLLAPSGFCTLCDCDHQASGHVDEDGYLIYAKLIEWSKKQSGGGIANEVVLNHLIEEWRMEVANFVRSLGGTKELGEN